MTTMREVAALAKVSAKTVSRVFNSDPQVAPGTRARVEAVLRELNYVPNTLATTFRSGRAAVVGIAVPDIADPFFAAIAKSVEEHVSQRGMSILVTNLGQDPSREPEVVEALLRRSLSGLVIAPVSSEQSYLRLWAERTPIVFVDRGPNGVVADAITEDDHGGAFEATAHLIVRGHRRIAFLGDRLDLPTTRARLAGFRDAMDHHGIPRRDAIVLLGVGSPEHAARALRAPEFLANRPTAVFSSNARCTMAALPLLKEAGCAIVGFGDFPMAEVLTPSLTVIDPDACAMGRLAAERILDRLDHPQRDRRRRTVVPVRLIERSSSTHWPGAGIPSTLSA